MIVSGAPDTRKQDVLVILPTYNRAHLLPLAIDSVLLQDHPDKKLVVVDDGSTDGTRDLCLRYVEDRPGIVAYVFKTNGGCASARNVGLESIDGRTRYVCFVDSDDRLLPGKISREVALLSCHPEASFSYSDSVLFEEETGREELRKVAAAGVPDRFPIEHFRTLEAKPASILYRVEVFRGLRFREDLLYNEDSDFLQKVALECRGVYCDEPGSWVRSHPGSKSRNLLEINRAVFRSCRDILRDYPEFYRQHAAVVDQRMEQLRLLLFQVLMERRLYGEARSYARTVSETMITFLRIRGNYEACRKWESFLRKPKRLRRAFRKAESRLRRLMGRREVT